MTTVGAMTDPSALPDLPASNDEHPLRDRVVGILSDLDVTSTIDSDGDVAFAVDGQQLFARCTESEMPLLRVFGQWQIEDDLLADPVKLYETCNEVNLNLNHVKTGIAGSTLVVTGEHIVTAQADLAALVQVSIPVLLGGVHIWHQRVAGIEPLMDEDPSEP
jgi:hypothetical protein